MYNSLNLQDSHNKASSPPHPSDAGTPDTISSGATTPEPFDPHSDITGNGNDQTVNDFTSKLHPFENRVSESPTGEEPDERIRTDDDEEEEGRGQGRTPKMDVDLDGGRGDEEMNCRLYRLVLQSGLTDFSSSEDEPDRAGQSEAERRQERGLEEEDKEQEQKTERPTYTHCQLEKEVEASQFSAENELDRMGAEDKGEEDEDGKKEDLAVKLCRLANEVDATQFSSTEDELDKVGRGEDEEESMGEEMPWKLQPDKTQLCDLASLVSASQFSSTEDELDRAGEEGDCREEKEPWEGDESIGDIDMEMFDLREESEEREQRVLKSLMQSEDDESDVQRSRNLLKRTRRDAATEEGEFCDENVEHLKAAKELRAKQEINLDVTKTDDEPEANGSDKTEEKFLKDRERKRETAAKSDEDAEFDRIISSMLLMTLEDMQVETLDKDAANARKNEQENDDDEGGESGFRKRAFDAKSQAPSEKHASEGRSEFAVKEYVEEETEGERSTKDETTRSEKVEEGHFYLTKEQLTDTTEKEAEQQSPDELKEEGRGNATERAAAETREDVYEDRNPDDTEQSSSSDRLGGFLSPEEIQNVSTAAVSSF